MNNKNKLNILVDVEYKFVFKKYFQMILDIFSKELNYKKSICVDVLITDNKHIKTISKEYRDIDKETDVLSFPLNIGFNIKNMDFIPLGEIILSHQKIKEQALKFNHSIKREFCYLFAHGLVHLSGKDHKASEDEEKNFNNIVYNIMKKANISR